MNKLTPIVLMVMAALAFTFTACEPDEPVVPIGPTVTLISGAGYVTAVDTLAPDSSFTVRLSVANGNSPLESVTLFEDGIRIDDLDRFRVEGVPGTSNPFLVFDADTSGFTKDITIVAHSVVDETRTYTLEVADANGLKAEVSVEITTRIEMVAGTPVDTLTGKLLLNAGGPAGQGGIDLKTGQGTGSNDPNAHIKDLGIDINLPNDQNWLQKIGSTSGATLAVPAAGVDFDLIDTKEKVEEAFNNGTVITETANKVQIGDVYLASRNGEFFIFRVTDITITPMDNKDSYTLSIKF